MYATRMEPFIATFPWLHREIQKIVEPIILPVLGIAAPNPTDCNDGKPIERSQPAPLATWKVGGRAAGRCLADVPEPPQRGSCRNRAGLVPADNVVQLLRRRPLRVHFRLGCHKHWPSLDDERRSRREQIVEPNNAKSCPDSTNRRAEGTNRVLCKTTHAEFTLRDCYVGL
jgi:hypothetical protein